MPYWLDPGELAWLAARTGQSPQALIPRALIQLMPEIPAQLAAGTLRTYLECVKIDDQPLWQHGLWNLIAKGVSPDGYNAARATVGYDCLGGNTNALDLICEFFDFTPGVEFRMVNAGYETVPWQLQRRFEAAGGSVQMETWLEGFSGVTFADGSNGVELRFLGGEKRTARAIVLGMPRRAIELLKADGEVLGDAKFRNDLASVSGIPLFKAFLLYPQSWWQTAGVSGGRSLTDLPLRQCYYWPVGPDGLGTPKPTDPGMVMAYDDLQSVDFWRALDPRERTPAAGSAPAANHHPLFRRMATLDGGPVEDPYAVRLLDNWRNHTANAPMVAELHRQLLQMHGIDNAPEPIDAAYMDWSRDPYGGGVHLWNVNYHSKEMLPRMTQPVDGFPCYLCGEAYSTNQTWAEGALQTAEIVLQQRLGLPSAEWQHG